MKQVYFLVIGFLFCLPFQAQIINIPDANFKAKLLEADVTNTIAKDANSNNIRIDVNNNGEIEESEALLVYKLFNLNVPPIRAANQAAYDAQLQQSQLNYNISDLTGIAYFTNLTHLVVMNNNLTTLDLSNNINIISLFCNNNVINSINLGNNSVLRYFNCTFNQLTSLDLSQCVNLQKLYCYSNQLTTLTVNAPQTLLALDCNNNQISSDFDFTNYTVLDYFNCGNNNVSSLTFGNNNSLVKVECNNNNLTSLDFSNSSLVRLNCIANPNLTFVNVKNGIISPDLYVSQFPEPPFTEDSFMVNNNPSLQYICYDEGEFGASLVNSQGIGNISRGTYCSFTPGGDFNTITGNITYDCGGQNILGNNQKIIINSGSQTEFSYCNSSGNYTFYTGLGEVTVFPELVGTNYFTVTPVSYTYNFSTPNNTETANFCISPNGVHPDLAVTIIPTSPARPGFDATYNVIYQNQGNQIQSGTVNLSYQDAVLDLVTAMPTVISNANNMLSWDFVNLQPYETRSISIALNVNSPMETPPVNNGDILSFTATITSPQADETPADNTMSFEQTVVGSYDPNDKAVVEGEQISISQIGEYLHYVIRFQNMGTAPAENVVVKDMLNDKLDLTTLQMVSSSHPYRSTLTAGNKLEFFYEGINLPAAIDDEPGSHGYIAFKIKPKNTVVVNDVITNNANIYFDFNFPIETNTVSTTVTALKNTGFESSSFSLYPNPTNGVLNILLTQNETIKTATIYNLIGQKLMMFTNSSSLDVGALPKGSYLLTLETTGGITTKRFVKM